MGLYYICTGQCRSAEGCTLNSLQSIHLYVLKVESGLQNLSSIDLYSLSGIFYKLKAEYLPLRDILNNK